MVCVCEVPDSSLHNKWLNLRPLLCPRPFLDPLADVKLAVSISLRFLWGTLSRSWWLGGPRLPVIRCPKAPGFPSLCSPPFRKWSDFLVPRKADAANLSLTCQDRRVLMGGVEGALAFPLHDLVLGDGHQVGILEFLKGGRGWGPERQSLTSEK